MIVMVFLVAAAILTASVVYDVKNRREMAAELEDWSEVKSRRIRRREKLFLAISIFCFKPALSCLPLLLGLIDSDDGARREVLSKHWSVGVGVQVRQR